MLIVEKRITKRKTVLHLVASCTNPNRKRKERENKLLIDSGCTDHILTDQKFFNEISKPSPVKYIYNADTLKQKIHGIGSAEIDVAAANGTCTML